MITLFAIGFAPREAGGYPGKPGEAGAGEEPCDGDEVARPQGVAVGSLDRRAGESVIGAESADMVFQPGKQLLAQAALTIGRAKEQFADVIDPVEREGRVRKGAAQLGVLMDKRHAGGGSDDGRTVIGEYDAGIGCLGILAQVVELVLPAPLVQIGILPEDVEA